MRKTQIRVGATYAVKVSGVVVPVTLHTELASGGWLGRNEKTSRNVRVKTAARLRYEVVAQRRPEGGRKWVKVT